MGDEVKKKRGITDLYGADTPPAKDPAPAASTEGRRAISELYGAPASAPTAEAEGPIPGPTAAVKVFGDKTPEKPYVPADMDAVWEQLGRLGVAPPKPDRMALIQKGIDAMPGGWSRRFDSNRILMDLGENSLSSDPVRRAAFDRIAPHLSEHDGKTLEDLAFGTGYINNGECFARATGKRAA